MPEVLREVMPPKGFARWLFRLPISFYNYGLGWLLGNRFLELTHTGRKTGLPRHTVLEVVRHDRHTGEYFAAVGFGKKTDWYQNILRNPNVTIRSGRNKVSAVAKLLSADESGNELVTYARHHPIAFREIVKVLGLKINGTNSDIHALGELVQVVTFSPLENSTLKK